MAYAALLSLTQTLLEQVIDGDQYLLVSPDEEHHIKTLHKKLVFLQSLLEESANNSGETFDSLEKRIRDATYEAQDVIESYISDQIRSEGKLHVDLLEKDLYVDLQTVMEKIDSITEEIMEKRSNRIEDPAPSRSLGAGSSRRRAPSSSDWTVGFDADLLEIKARLCGGSSKRQIISIVGMGGIGKTTLARNIFDDSLIAEHFDLHAWTTISQEYRKRDMLIGLANSLKATNECSSDEKLDKCIYQRLIYKRYLIIVDDMWSTEAWDDLRKILPDDGNASRVIITSRLLEVATYADSSSPYHQMHLLNEDQSWRRLLQQQVFAQESCPPILENLGKRIAENCGGLPLAVIIIAGLLSKVEMTPNHWEKFAAKVNSTLETNDEHLLKILSLSYKNLPHHLRACFLYIGGFPEDSEIPISKLTMLWVAEGFLKPVTSKSLEEVAEEHVVDLFKRNLISITRKSSNGKFRFCRIHDLLRDFCIRKARDENFLHVNKNDNTSKEGLENKRRLFNFVDYSLLEKGRGSVVRSVSCSKDGHGNILSLLTTFELLRVLDAPKFHSTEFPVAVTDLFHLRYLAFSHCFHYLAAPFLVPASILKLKNLQSLIIHHQKAPHRLWAGPDYKHDSKIHLPPDIWKMPKLRHLILHNYFHLDISLDGIGGKAYVLQNLHTLSRVANFDFAKEIVEMIPNLKKLTVTYHIEDDKTDLSQYHLNNVRHLCQLESLNLCCSFQIYSWSRVLSSFGRDNFALPRSLKKLTLTGCRVPCPSLTLAGQLPNLEVLKLRDGSAMGEEWEPMEGEFMKLKFLLMQGLQFKRWLAESRHFPSLEHLIIYNCWYLEEIPLDIGDISTLQSIKVVNVDQSTRDSAARILEEQRNNGNDLFQVIGLLK